jgi:hypothetical protein
VTNVPSQYRIASYVLALKASLQAVADKHAHREDSNAVVITQRITGGVEDRVDAAVAAGVDRCSDNR